MESWGEGGNAAVPKLDHHIGRGRMGAARLVVLRDVGLSNPRPADIHCPLPSGPERYGRRVCRSRPPGVGNRRRSSFMTWTGDDMDD